MDCNLSAREGLGTIHVSGPRCNGLQGEELSGAVQWSGDSVRLKGATLQQANSRSTTPSPLSEAAWRPCNGRWGRGRAIFGGRGS